MGAHGTKVGAAPAAVELAEDLLRACYPELTKLTAAVTVRDRSSDPRVLAEAERAARAAARSIELELEAALAPHVGQKVGLRLRAPAEILRLAIVNVVGFEVAARIRNRVARPPALVCTGNPVAGPERYDHLYGRGCGVVFRGQWRRSRKGPDGTQVALGPRCPTCSGAMTADLEALQVRRKRGR